MLEHLFASRQAREPRFVHKTQRGSGRWSVRFWTITLNRITTRLWLSAVTKLNKFYPMQKRYTYTDIALKLGCTERTVRRYVRMYRDAQLPEPLRLRRRVVADPAVSQRFIDRAGKCLSVLRETGILSERPLEFGGT